MSECMNKEVFLSDLVLCSVNAPKEQRIPLNRKKLIIGVAEGCDMVLPRDAGVSRVHAKIYFNEEDRQFYVQDQGSSNGTYLNEVRLRKDTPKILYKGDSLRFATAMYTIKSAYYQ
ncbi:MAG: FHA domain-containing protein [Clostridia bacterium]|nr:FHA domain-containing protein [Clostridia bacterium]